MEQTVKINKHIEEISENYINTILNFAPVMGTMLGLYQFDGKIGSFTPDAINGFLQKINILDSELEKINQDELEIGDKIDYMLLKSEIHKNRREYEVEKTHQIEPSTGPEMCFGSIYGLLFRHQGRMNEKVGDMFSRMREFPRYLKEAGAHLTNPPKIYIENAIESAESGKYLFGEQMDQMFTGDMEKHREEYNELKGKVLSAMDEYKEFLKTEIMPRSVPDFAIGRDAFNDRLKNDNFMDEDADTLEEMGKNLFEQFDTELKELAKEIDPELSWADIVRKFKKDHPTPDEMLTAYKRETALAKAFTMENDLVTIPPDEKVEIIFTPPSQRHLIPWAAFFPCAHFDRESYGHFIVTPPNTEFPPDKQESQMQEHNWYKMKLNSVHEVYPGHHLQLTYARENPRLARALSMNTVFVEGWALYTEELMRELGYFRDPVQILFQLKDKVWRAARIIIDVGLHVKGMKVEEAVKILSDTIGYSEYAALTEVKRYSRSPTQPMSYLTGLMKILDMRRRFQAKYPELPLKEFHDRMMICGSLPPKLMEMEIGL